MFLIQKVFRKCGYVVLFVIFLGYGPIPPYTNFTEVIQFAPTIPLEGTLVLEDKLKTSELYHKGDLIGAETFAQYDGELYASLIKGEVVKLKENNEIETVVKTGNTCRGYFEEKLCGRAMGIKFDIHGNLFVADSYYGIFKVDVKTGTKELLISPDEQIGGKKPKVFNSLAVAKNGDIYWSDSSSDFTFDDIVYDILSDSSGRLIHYNATSRENTILIDKMSFSNGVMLSDDEDFVINSELLRNRIQRYHLKGTLKGTADIFIDGLPGMPDNIQSDGRGGFLVALYMGISDDNPSIIQLLGNKPFVRKIAAKFMGLIEFIFNILNEIYPTDFFQKITHFIGHGSSMKILNPSRVTVLRLSKEGEILDCLHNLNGRISQLSEAYIFKDKLYFGSPYNDFIGRILLTEVGWGKLIQN
ncbi:adipocyte plasma membrane-associated protein Hemomucin-like [Diorhabda sublineata]|uniref:adipocyte plasma membrane-associated protein Hemomucin-like n=1 Tax=Diorhabda sublineata TaxID=1163346 RepID=UPI0024E0B53F|nr:adipocyte plasma membrane-associated protein Hemomucin-like [Diorhabda sublineata]